MILGLAHPGLFWTGAALISVPILIHFFFKRRHRVVRWAAMDFLLAALRKQKRRIEIENLILLLLRCAVIFLVGLAIARPAVQAAAINPFGLGARAVVLVLDTSASMGAQSTGRHALDRARERAEALLGELPAQSKVTVVVTRDESQGGAPRAVLENATPEEARARLQTVSLAYGANEMEEVIRFTGRQLASLRGRRMVVLVTDLQRSDWVETAPATAGETKKDAATKKEGLRRALGDLPRGDGGERPPVVILDVGQDDQANVVIADVRIDEGRVAFANDRLNLNVRVANYGPRGVSGTVTLHMMPPGATRWEKKQAQEIDVKGTAGMGTAPDKTATFYVDLPPDVEGPARFRVVFKAGGDTDRVPGDSERFLALEIRPPIRILPVVSASGALDELKDLEFLQVLEFDLPVSPVALSKQDLSSAQIVLWADAETHEIDQDGAARLEAYVRGGGALLAYLGQFANPAPVNRLFFKPRGEGLFPMLLRDQKWFNEQSPTRIEPQSRDRDSILFRETDKVEIFPSPVVNGYWPVKDVHENAIVAARYGDKDNGDPAVLMHRLGAGRVIVVTTTPDERWIQMNGTLLPAIFFFNATHWLVHKDPKRMNKLVGERVEIRLMPGARTVLVEPPDEAGGRTEEPVADPSKGFVLTDTAHPGFYRLTVKGVRQSGASARPVETVHLVAVNRDPGEGDLRRIPTSELTNLYRYAADLKFTSDVDEVVPRASGDREDEMSRAIFAGVIGILFLELFLAWRFGKRRRAAA